HELLALSPAEALQVDQACDRFEAAWRAGERPDPVTYLGAAGGAARPAPLRPVLAVGLGVRRRAGGQAAPGGHHTRLPGDGTLIDAVSREMSESPVSTRVESSGAGARTASWAGAGAPAPPGEADPGTGSASRRYELVREVGRGGIGMVFRGRDRR